MPATPKHDRSERTRTDASLAVERGKTDDELGRRADALASSADADAERTRARDDHALERERATTDGHLRRAGVEPEQLEIVDGERRREDERRDSERARTDARATSEREARRAALIELLASEREDTDQQLLLERDGADVAIGSRDEFLAMVSHDLRNMLGGIAMSATSLLRTPGDAAVKEAIGKDARRIQRFSARMNQLIGDLLDVVSIEAGHLAITLEAQDAAEIIRETVDVYQALAASKGIELTGVTDGPLLAHLDHDRILQVLANLVGNALKFTPAGGRIGIRGRMAGDEVQLVVADTGTGIPEDKVGRIFDRFWQLDRSATRSGLGLGLHICKSIVEAHRGHIAVESQPGRGTTFLVTLPAVR